MSNSSIEFELAYFEALVKHVNHYARRTPPLPAAKRYSEPFDSLGYIHILFILVKDKSVIIN